MLFILLEFIYFAPSYLNIIEQHEKSYCSDIGSPVNCHAYGFLYVKFKMCCIRRRQAKISNRKALTDTRR